MSDEASLPVEVKNRMAAVDAALSQVESNFEPWLALQQHEQTELNSKLSPLDKAKLELVAAYSVNSLFWMYLNVCGVNPKAHAVKQELDRIRSYMNRAKQIQDAANAPRPDIPAAKRFIKSALWQQAKEKQGSASPAADSSKSVMTPPTSDRKRAHHHDEGHSGKKSHKKKDKS